MKTLGGTSVTDTPRWRTFCKLAAKDLGLLDHSDVLDEIVSGREFAERRYEAIAAHLATLFDGLAGFRIIEIGGGYGGQAAAILRRFRGVDYAIRDLPEPRLLQRAYLTSLGLSIAPARGHFDLLLSNYALSECHRAIQIDYARQWGARCARGYITWNGWITEDGLSLDELRTFLPPSRLELEPLEPHPNNCVIVWP